MKNIFSFLIPIIFFTSYAFAQWTGDPDNPLAPAPPLAYKARAYS
jgi:hypothetical protein